MQPVVLGVAIAAVAIAVVVIVGFTFTGFTGFVIGGPDPQETVLEAIEKQGAADAYDILYNVTYLVSAGGQDINMSGTMRIRKKNNSTHLAYDLDLGGAPERLQFDIYTVPSGTYQCFSLLGANTCTQIRSSATPVPSPVEQAAQIAEFVNRSVVSLIASGSDTIAGRPCTAVRADYDVTKFAEQEGVSLPEDSIRSIAQTACYDKDSGLPLQLDMDMEVAGDEGVATALLKTRALSIELDSADISLPTDAEIVTLDQLGGLTIDDSGG